MTLAWTNSGVCSSPGMKVCWYSRIWAAPASRFAYSACRSPIPRVDSHHPRSPASRAIVMTWVHRSPSTPSASRIFITSAWSTTCPFSSREICARDSPIRRATCSWVIPAAARNSRSSAPSRSRRT